MAHRLAKSMRGVDRILMNGRWTGNFSNLAQVQPRYSEFRQFILQSSVYFSHEFEKPVGPNEGRSGGAVKMKGKKTAKKGMNKGPDNASSKSRSKFAPNQGSKSGGNGDGGGDRRKKGSGPGLGEEFAKGRLALLLLIYSVTPAIVCTWRHTRRNIYEVIAWKDFMDNYLIQGRVAQIEFENHNRFRVLTAPGASGDVAKTVLVKIDSLDSFRNIASMGMKPVPYTAVRVDQHKGQETDKKNIHNTTHTAPSTSLLTSAIKAPSQDLNLCCNGDAAWDRRKNSRTAHFEENNEHKNFAVLILSSTTLLFLAFCRILRNNRFNAITRKGLKDYLVSSRVAKVEVTEEKSLRVQPFPGTSMEYKETLRIKTEKFKSAKNEAPEHEKLKRKVEHKNRAPVVHKKNPRK